jgi:uncharacterized membrane protein
VEPQIMNGRESPRKQSESQIGEVIPAEEKQQSITDPKPQPNVSLLIRLAVLIAIAALGCMLFYLTCGFSPWTFGVGILLGVPLLVIAMLFYIIQVVRDIHGRGAL